MMIASKSEKMDIVDILMERERINLEDDADITLLF